MNVNRWKTVRWKIVFVIVASTLAGAPARADGSGDPAVASSDNGKYADKDGNPAKDAEASCTGIK